MEGRTVDDEEWTLELHSALLDVICDSEEPWVHHEDRFWLLKHAQLGRGRDSCQCTVGVSSEDELTHIDLNLRVGDAKNVFMKSLVHLFQSFADQKHLFNPDFDLLFAVLYVIGSLRDEAYQLAILVLCKEA